MGGIVLVGTVVSLSAVLVLWAMRRTRAAIRRRIERATLRVVHRFHLRLNRHSLTNRKIVHDQLINDPVIGEALHDYCRNQGVDEEQGRKRVAEYVNEIVPFFNVLSYYKLAYNLARLFLGLLYRVSSSYKDQSSNDAVPRDDVVIYLMNHRSNADYVVVTYLLAHGVSVSYAVGEWARIWPLDRVFKSFGAYFVRRGFREPLYHTVLERYIRLTTRNGVTQGIFIEGGLSRNGALRPPKIGLLDYCVRTVLDPDFQKDIWLVPVAINYDRVLEDRTLIRESTRGYKRTGRLRQLANVTHYVFFNFVRLLTGNLKKYGRVAVNFGTPISVRHWCASKPGMVEARREERAPVLKDLAEQVLSQIATDMPITPVPLVAAALLSFGETLVRRGDLLDRVDEYRDHLTTIGARLAPESANAAGTLDRAWRMLRMRRLAVRDGDSIVVLPGQRPLLEFYANSIVHLLPSQPAARTMHPATDPDNTLPHLDDSHPLPQLPLTP